ncbi:4-hydroxy-tetrahydrodipicolinate reductase [Nocardiopsis sp. LOL_012]|uniref:4-hydroxy-tetrahydrodipicolinate reductase n=1 Tax=Nocardiopsis sp. LOL_012 TaxID=3345409 RepID=UPI003A881F2F
MTIPVVVCGSSGRMSDLIAAALNDTPDLRAAARLSLRPTEASAADSGAVRELGRVCVPEPVVVDFTAPQATRRLLHQARTVPCSLVIGTSGLTDGDRSLMREVGRERTIVTAANFSVVLLAMARFVRELGSLVDHTWDAGVVDVHFAGKKDRPSATARYLAEQWPGPPGREAAPPEVAAFRMGDGVSEHRVLASGTGEHVEVLHRVADRTALLPGILRSVRFAAHAGPGVHTLEDVVDAGPDRSGDVPRRPVPEAAPRSSGTAREGFEH